MKSMLKKIYWVCILVCICLIVFCGSTSDEGVLGFFGLAILIIVPLTRSSKKKKQNVINSKRYKGYRTAPLSAQTPKWKEKKKSSADRWYEERHREIQLDQADYQMNMEIYRKMMKNVDDLKREANATSGYRRNDLLREADNLKREAQKHYRSLI